MKWSLLEVTNWLGSLNLHHLIANFERMQIDGEKLAALNDQDLRLKLRITKPAEVMAIKGALSKLQEDGFLNNQKRRISSPKALSTTPGLVPRDRAGSYEKDGNRAHTKTVSQDVHRNTIAAESVRQPKLMHGSASELIEHSKYSGWIRKQGGSFKSCEPLVCMHAYVDRV